MDKTYLQAATVLALTLLSTSLAYLVNYSTPKGFLVFLSVPILYGYVAHISKEGFNRSSLAALPALAFIAIGGLTAVASIITGIGAVLVSVFAGGERFRSYYGSTHLPLLFLGLIIGSLVFVTVSNDPQLEEKVQNRTAEFLGETGERIVDQSNILSSQKDQQADIVENTANATVLYTKASVMNQTREDFSYSQLKTLNAAFDKAQSEIPTEMSDRIRETNVSVDISSRVGDAVSAQFEGKHMAVFIPLIVSLMIALQPFVGLLTALFAKAFDWSENYVSLSPS